MLRKTSEGSNDIQQKQVNQIRKLNEEINEYKNEKQLTDKVTNELLHRAKKYEEDI